MTKRRQGAERACERLKGKDKEVEEGEKDENRDRGVGGGEI